MDPRFIGGDGIVFYFHGKSNEHYSLVSDPNLQINARFIGLRPSGRRRDYTWIHALGILFNSQTLSLEATPAAVWNEEVDHLKFSYDGQKLDVPKGYSSSWTSASEDLQITVFLTWKCSSDSSDFHQKLKACLEGHTNQILKTRQSQVLQCL